MMKISMKKLPVTELLFSLSLCLLISVSVGSSDGGHLITCLASDREALMDFKTGLHDPHNVLSSWKGENCCQWHGIQCDNNTKSVISVDLHNPYLNSEYESSSRRYVFWNLSGEIRPSLMKLKSSLRHLDLSFNTFNGIQIPEFFGSLENLQYLNLSYAGFSGLIPAHLGNLSHLKVLDLDNFKYKNEFYADNFQWITGLISLEHLAMNGANLSLVKDWAGALNQLPSIVELHLSSCYLSGYIPSMASLNFSSLAVMDLSDNNFHSKIPDWLVNISSLQYINMSRNNLYGRIPLGLGDLPNLLSLDLYGSKLTASCPQLFRKRWEKIQVLDLSGNKMHGKLPSTLGNMTSLVLLDLSYNAVGGGIPSSVGKLCNLNYFSLSTNSMTGSLDEILKGTESCIFKNPMPKLRHLDLSYNQFGGKIPYWLGQLENLVDLDLSNNLFEGHIPTSLGSLQNLSTLNLAENKLNGTLPRSIGQLSALSTFDVSSNQFTGIIFDAFFSKLTKLTKLYLSSNSFTMNFNSNWIPPFQVKELGFASCNLGPSFPAWLRSQKDIIILDLSKASISDFVPNWFWNGMPRMTSVSLSQNHLSGQMPKFVGETCNLEMIDLSRNNFTGRIPSSLSNCTETLILDLSSNTFSGAIPYSLGQLNFLQILHLSNNQLSGKLPSSFINLSFLKILDLGNNGLSGEIPTWFSRFPYLSILILRSNAFFGEIPFKLSKIRSLQVLDIAENNLSGNIPKSFGNIISMAQENTIMPGEKLYRMYKDNKYYQIKLVVNAKRQSMMYTNTFFLITCIDLSGNNLSGRFPEEITNLSGLLILNLSRNHITGNIPESISNMHQLSSLDLSSNQLTGPIPQSLSSLSFLGYLNLSYNNLSGAIPYTGHTTTFEASSFVGNPDLYGCPLPVKCLLPNGDGHDNGSNIGASNDETNDGYDDVGLIDMWFYLSLGVGFAAGLLIPYFILAMKRSWSDAYFDFVEVVVVKFLVLIRRRRINHGGRINPRRRRQ